MEYAVIETGGKQYKVTPGMVLEVEKLEGENDSSISFSKVLMHVVDGKVLLGEPYLADILVTGKLVTTFKDKKVIVSKFRAKSKHRRATGHRQQLTRVQIDEIRDNKKEKEKKTTSSIKKEPMESGIKVTKVKKLQQKSSK